MKESQAVTTTVNINFDTKNTKCKRAFSDREWNPIDSSWFYKPNIDSCPFMKCYVSISC